MNATRTSAGQLTATVILLGLARSAGLAGAQARPAADCAAEGTTKIVRQSVLIEQLQATVVEQRLKAAGAEPRPTGENLEDGARGFGESNWDGMKSVGRSLQKLLTGS